MLPRSERLSRSDFQLLKKRGTHVHGALCTLSYLQAPTLGVGVVVSKKVARRAVDRNLLRRRVYAVFKELRADIKLAYYIVILKKKSDTASFSELQSDIKNVLQKANCTH